MVSDVLFDSVQNIDDYLSSETYKDVYPSEVREEIVAVRTIMERLRLRLDALPSISTQGELAEVRPKFSKKVWTMTRKEADDIVVVFAITQCQVVEGTRTKFGEVYEAYVDFCRDNEFPVTTGKKFVRRICAAIPGVERAMFRGKGYLCGIELS
jgi:hypothetical protein